MDLAARLDDLVTLRCPLCGGILAQATPDTMGTLRVRCYARRCVGPIVDTRIEGGRALPAGMVDRHTRRRVGSTQSAATGGPTG